MSPKLQTILLLLSTGTALLVLSQFFLFADSLEPMWREDSVVENLQSVFYLLASVAQLCIVVLCVQGNGGRRRRALHFLLFLLFLFVGMEEISWGQRLFGWETPDFLEDINLQAETNIHNLFGGVLSPFNILLFVFINAYCYLLPLAHHLCLDARRLLQSSQLPLIHIDLVSIFILADIVRPIELDRLDGQLTLLLSLLPLGLYISRKVPRLFEGLECPALQVSCICLVGVTTSLLGLLGPRIPTLWLWESRELLLGMGFMSYSLFDVWRRNQRSSEG